jgi:hypothetical protein
MPAHRLGLKRGIATECIGGGQGGAMLIEAIRDRNEDTHAPVLDVLGSRNLELGPFTAEGKDDASWVHWKMRADENGIVWLLLDVRKTPAQTRFQKMHWTELDAALAKIEQDRPRARHPLGQMGFIAGADINEFRGVTDPAKIEPPSRALTPSSIGLTAPVADDRGHSWILPRRRSRGGARLRPPHRDR